MKAMLKAVSLIALSVMMLSNIWPPNGLPLLFGVAFIPLIQFWRMPLTAILSYGGIYLVWLGVFFLANREMFLLDELERVRVLKIGLFILPLIWTAPFAIADLMLKRQSKSALWAFPFMYISMETAHYYWPVSFTWMHGSWSLATTSLAGLGYFLSPALVALLALYCNVVLVHALEQYRNKVLRLNSIMLMALPWLIIAAGLIINVAQNSTHVVRVAVFSPEKVLRDSLNDNVLAQATWLREAFEQSGIRNVDLLVCPEDFFKEKTHNPLFTNNLPGHPAIQSLLEFSKKHQLCLLSGASLVQLYQSAKPPTLSAKRQSDEFYFDVYNGSFFVTPNGQISWRSKQHLVPIVEEIPFYKLFNTLNDVGLWPDRYDHTYGTVKSDEPYRYGSMKIAPLVCFEGTFPQVTAGYGVNGANLYALLTTKWSKSEIQSQRQLAFSNALSATINRPVVVASFNGEIGAFSGDHKLTPQEISGWFNVYEININSHYGFVHPLNSNPWILFVLSIIVVIMLRKRNFSMSYA